MMIYKYPCSCLILKTLTEYQKQLTWRNEESKGSRGGNRSESNFFNHMWMTSGDSQQGFQGEQTPLAPGQKSGDLSLYFYVTIEVEGSGKKNKDFAVRHRALKS